MRFNTQAEYIKEIKSILPKEAFAPASDKLPVIFAYLIALIVLYFAFRLTQETFVYIILSLALAHCLASLGFFAHDLSHQAIIRTAKYRYPLEVLLFGVNLLPATLWDHLHNRTHHVHMNAVSKPAAHPSQESNRQKKWYGKFFLPTKRAYKFNPLFQRRSLAEEG